MSLNPPDASEFADELARAVVDGSARQVGAGMATGRVSGREWLILDAAAQLSVPLRDSGLGRSWMVGSESE